MQKIVLPNGLTVIFKKKESNSVVVEIMVKVGSNNEQPTERGISHFIEHILFEGTNRRPTNQQISNEVEKIGGEFNAYTTNERTCFYVKVLKKHFSIAIDVLADILQNPLLKEEDIKKEKNIIVKEIDLVNDEPRYYQWDLLQKTLYENHPTRYPVYGEKKVIKNLNRNKLLNYFQKYYVPNNIVISVVGNIKNWREAVKQNFTFQKSKLRKKKTIKEPKTTKNKEKKEKRNIANTYAVMGFKTVPKTHPDSYVLEVINGILGRGQSGRMFNEIRAKKGLAYDVGTQNLNDISYGYFAVYATIDKKNLTLVKELILGELNKLKNVSDNDIKEAKTYIEGDYLLELEDPQKTADQLLFWEQAKDARFMDEFIKKIRKVTVKDVKRVVEKYFHYYTFVVVEGK